jgi:signal transduction histidine kinase
VSRPHALPADDYWVIVTAGLKQLFADAIEFVGVRGMCSSAWIICCIVASLQCGKALAQEPLPRSVLVINQFELSSPASAAVLSSFRSTLRSGSTAPVSVFIENLDLGRFRGARFEEAVQSYFGVKYQDTSVGVVVAVGSAALELALRLRPGLWPKAPVIFAIVEEGVLARLSLPPGVTGTTVRAPVSDAVTVARSLVPGLKRLAVVGDPPERQFIRERMQAQLDLLVREFELIDLTRLKMAELKRRVASLPDHSAIIYVGLTVDADNVAYTSYEALAEIAAVANRPIVVQAETHLGTGAVGGIAASPASMGHETARLALRVLDGENASSIPVTTGNFMKPVFDWRQLQRWNIGEERLPPGSEVRFRVPNIWDQYKWYIISAVALCTLQAVFILFLLVNRRRLSRAHIERRRAEEAAHELSGRLINAQEEERSRLARELHDDVTQRLALLAIDAGREERSSARAGNTTMRAMRENLVRLSEDVHALSYRLHPSILEDLGLSEALKAECERFSRGCPIHLQADDDIPEKLPRDVALCLFRIAQEALRNIARHAGASRTDVRLRRLDGGLQLVVSDNGTGFDPAQHRTRMSLGHAGMQQRVFFLGGRIHIDSTPGHGTRIVAWVPLKGERSEPAARVAS